MYFENPNKYRLAKNIGIIYRNIKTIQKGLFLGIKKWVASVGNERIPQTAILTMVIWGAVSLK